ncbi:sulfate/molybdate ABC transporter ATP-binding protein [Cellulomonas chengniuliangii]|uniref:ATP-binding cassette domain-containing protein n=1 Tax=Cellulomonas chengniuliangii TaxID=2968084 RepID=A0ABY5KTW8_9CELL|nr:ATP-binding cassette domain-containing protein [Cellulomonas chengniuliangii]MCC2308516.1 ATP-binding cassette domain-containing protein [Cellulomonas chengniuliangii]MCC2317533.1 ATP-binding cassette domain-containing protein [Cellulomonas chengniuliangii]UUI73880.1 ATP-binding cassette domain-containing protein [Cellulomonas chengniuliangii]
MSDLEARFSVRRGDFELDLDLAAAEGEVLAVLGPNGAGKSTLLAVLAGLLRPSEGFVRVGDQVLTDVPVAGRARLVAPEHRAVGLLGQDGLVFPHLTALENVAFGPRSVGVRRAEAARRATGWLEAVGLAGMALRRPAELSGGQRQRVALARALAAEPRVLLLDEPLAALDVGVAPQLRQVLREQVARTGTTTVLVTHDVLDAVVLADRVIVLDGGAVVDEGLTAQVLAAPRDPFTATLAGVNLVVGEARDGGVRAPDGRHVAGREPIEPGGQAAAVFAPSAVAVHTRPPAGASPRNVWRTHVVALEPGQAVIRVRTAGSPEVVADLTPAAVAELGLAPGSEVWLSVKATEVGLHRR